MTITKENSKGKPRCPKCNREGKWDVERKIWRCETCGIVNFATDVEPIETKPIENNKDYTFDYYYENKQKRVVQYYFPNVKVEELEIDYAKIEFQRYRLKLLVQKEKRHGRDHLRSLKERDQEYDLLSEVSYLVNKYK